jgi:predicted dehydrogenase
VKPRIAIVGPGAIAHYHAEAIISSQSEICAVVGRPNSATLSNFVEQHQPQSVFQSAEAFVSASKQGRVEFDAILLSTPWSVTEKIVLDLLELGKPVMAEKPVTLSEPKLRLLEARGHHTNLLCAYNRCHYPFMDRLQRFTREHGPMIVQAISSEPYQSILDREGQAIASYMPHYYTCHPLSILVHLFGELELGYIRPSSPNGKPSWTAVLNGLRAPVTIQFSALMDAPKRGSINITAGEICASLEPFEELSIYQGMDIDQTKRGRVFSPKRVEHYELEGSCKPGFLELWRYFLDRYVYEPNQSDDDFRKACIITSLCDQIANELRSHRLTES